MAPSLTRRQWLAGASALLATTSARAIGPGSLLKLAQLRYKGHWDPRPDALRVWAQELRYRTSIDIDLQRTAVDLSAPTLFDTPLLMLLGDGRFRFSNAQRTRLKAWIEAGGFLFVDNTGLRAPSAAFDRAVRTELRAIFPGRALESVPAQHVLYRCFYRLRFPAGRALHQTTLEGLFIEDRLAVLYGQNDLTGALDRDNVGGWKFDVVPGGEPQREKAHRFAINIVQYAMTLDYKDDQVHLDWLLHKRQWRIKPPRVKAE